MNQITRENIAGSCTKLTAKSGLSHQNIAFTTPKPQKANILEQIKSVTEANSESNWLKNKSAQSSCGGDKLISELGIPKECQADQCD